MSTEDKVMARFAKERMKAYKNSWAPGMWERTTLFAILRQRQFLFTNKRKGRKVSAILQIDCLALKMIEKDGVLITHKINKKKNNNRRFRKTILHSMTYAAPQRAVITILRQNALIVLDSVIFHQLSRMRKLIRFLYSRNSFVDYSP